MNTIVAQSFSQNLYRIVVLLYITMYVYTAVDKLMDIQYFTEALNAQVFDDKYTPLLRITLPTSELLCVVLLIIPRLQKIGLYLSNGLMLLFTIYVALVYFNFFKDAPCACGGLFRSLSWGQHLIVNLAFLALGVSAIKVGDKSSW